MRNEYPRPDFVREMWMSLNGPWRFECANERTWIQVPFVCQSSLSGIGKLIQEDNLIYQKTFCVPQEWKEKQVLLHFGAVDYKCQVFVNQQCVGSHTGGQTPFVFNITPYLNWQQEEIRVEVYDPLYDETIARGKQNWEGESRFIWYTPSSGIWQSVWLEPVESTYLEWIHFTPDIDEGTVQIEYRLADSAKFPCKLGLHITQQEKAVFDGEMQCMSKRGSLTVDIFQKKAMQGSFHFTGNYWTPENPILYDVKILVQTQNGDCILDEVSSYFGMRKIHIENGKLYLNNQPYFHKLLLDQGYWKEGLVTAPSDDDYKTDILKAKEMGFNGCRKHEKVEDPRFLYWADKLGFLVWEGMASFWSYTPQAAAVFTQEWLNVLHRDYNHPSIVVWGMLNESWGVPRIYSNQQQQNFAKALYYQAKSQDCTRLVVSNDGWEMVESDICTIHSYKHGGPKDKKQHAVFLQALKEPERFCTIMEKLPYVKGMRYEGQPIVLTECGGIAVQVSSTQQVSREDAIQQSQVDWGYTSSSRESFLDEYARIIGAIADSGLMSGFCYTQLTDVEQEHNGLLTQDHQFKFDPKAIKKINDQLG